jgi:MurNAc alpha-1-phosphate uridylyltransferase
MILAAGRGERMMPHTKNTPKPLIKVKGIALIEHAINALKRANITDIVINISYLGEQIQAHLKNGENFGVNITYSDESSGALETAGGIIKALPLLVSNGEPLGGLESQPFVVINSDVLCDYDLSKLSLPTGSLAHLALINNPDHNPEGDFTLVDNQRITLIKDKNLTFSGIGIYHPDFFKNHLQVQGKLALYPLLKEAIDNNQLSGEHHQGYWQDIGTPERLEKANNT